MPYSYEPHTFTDFAVGQEFETVGRTVTESDVVTFASISGDWTELHTNREYASEQHFERRVVHGPLTLSITIGLAARCGFMERTVRGFLGVERMQFPHPLFIDDTISADMTVTDTESLESRSDAGMVTIAFDVTNQDDVQVMDAEIQFLVADD